MLGKFKTDDFDIRWYFIPLDKVDEFDTMLSELGLLEFFDEEWETTRNVFNDKFGKYRVGESIQNYVVDFKGE